MIFGSRTALSALIVTGSFVISPPASALNCQQGIWDLTTTGVTAQGQEYQGTATSTRYCLFAGALQMDEYRALSANGDIVFLGASFNFWYDHGQRSKTLWVMGGDPGYTLIDGVMEGGRLASTGEGFDAGGEFLERSVKIFSGGQGYSFQMDRSYDGGESWITSFSTSRASYRSAEVPSLPAALHPIIQQAKDLLPAQMSGIAILEGFAELEELEKSADGKSMAVIRFSSMYRGPARWRSVFWALGADEISVEEIVLDGLAARNNQVNGRS